MLLYLSTFFFFKPHMGLAAEDIYMTFPCHLLSRLEKGTHTLLQKQYIKIALHNHGVFRGKLSHVVYACILLESISLRDFV